MLAALSKDLQELNRLLRRPLRMMWLSFWLGIWRGLGVALGMGLIAGVASYFLVRAVQEAKGVPFLGRYLGEVLQAAQQHLPQSGR